MTTGRHDARDTSAAEPLVTAAEAAALLGVSERTVRRRIAANGLPSVKAGRSRLIPVSAVTVSPVDDTADTAAVVPRHDTPDSESATVLALGDRIGGLEREVGRLTAELAAAQAQLAALPAGQDAPRTQPAAPGAAEVPAPAFTPAVAAWRERTTRAVDVDAAEPAPPWWRFWERRR